MNSTREGYGLLNYSPMNYKRDQNTGLTVREIQVIFLGNPMFVCIRQCRKNYYIYHLYLKIICLIRPSFLGLEDALLIQV